MLLQAIKLQHEGFQNPNAWLAQVYLARAYAAEGDTTKARTAYQDFLRLGRMPTPYCRCWARLGRNMRSCNERA
jgi:cytochrome c-type biogenesis protein CcmH/NrfG